MFAAACVVLAALCAWQPSSGAQEAPRPAGDEKQDQVRELFVQRCARCHGRDGRGATKLGEIVKAPDFTKADWWKGGVSDKRLREAIAEGKGEMPAFARRLSRSEISSLAAYVRTFAPARDGKR